MILIVDDNADNIEVLGEILSPEFEVKFALDGAKALQIAAGADHPELILLDIMMPGMDGYQVCRELKSAPRTAGIPVIFVSALTDEIDEAKGFEAGGVDYLTKPVSPLLVKARVGTHLRLRQAVIRLETQNEILAENVRLREEVERVTRHDLKAPLSAFINIPQMLAREKNITPDQAEMLGILAKSGNRMLEMINRSLDLAKMERRQYRLQPARVNLVQVATQVLQELSGLPNADQVTCALSIDQKPAEPGDNFEVIGEEYLFFCLLSNLVKNAMEASPAGGVVEIGFRSAPEKAIRIRNQGVIPAQIRDRFLQRYATFGKESGTGLGAYSAKLMTETMGGRLTFSTDEQTGTVLLAEFPAVCPAVKPLTPAPPEAVAPLPEPKGRTQETMNVLVADGNPLVRRVITNLLRQLGINSILEVNNGAEAILLLEKIAFDLVISDKVLSQKSGLDIVTFMRSRGNLRQIPFIMAGAQLTRADIIEAIGKGVWECLAKPFSPDVLRQKIEKVLGR